MDVAFWIDIEDSSGNKYGSGPIQNAISWQSVKRLSRAGEFIFTLPASDPQSDQIIEKRFARCTAVTDAGQSVLGAGIIDSVALRPEPGGNVVMEVAGSDTLRELTYRSVHSASLASGGSGVTHSSAVSTVEGYAPSGWTFTADPSPPNDDIYYQFAGETVLAAAIKVAELSDVDFYLNGDRQIIFSDSWSSTGLRAIEVPSAPDVSNAATCYISEIAVLCDTYDLLTRIYPFGTENADTRFDLTDTTRAAPTGYTLDVTNNFIKNNTIETNYGRIERVVHYRDVEKVGSAPADDIAAANTLFDVALAELQQDSQVAQFFELSVTHCSSILRPMQQIRCIFRRYAADGSVVANIDEVLNIIEATTRVDVRGLRTTRLQVADVQRPPKLDTDTIVGLVKDNKLRA